MEKKSWKRELQHFLSLRLPSGGEYLGSWSSPTMPFAQQSHADAGVTGSNVASLWYLSLLRTRLLGWAFHLLVRSWFLRRAVTRAVGTLGAPRACSACDPASGRGGEKSSTLALSVSLGCTGSAGWFSPRLRACVTLSESVYTQAKPHVVIGGGAQLHRADARVSTRAGQFAASPARERSGKLAV